jgi:hypothetical protein
MHLSTDRKGLVKVASVKKIGEKFIVELKPTHRSKCD